MVYMPEGLYDEKPRKEAYKGKGLMKYLRGVTLAATAGSMLLFGSTAGLPRTYQPGQDEEFSRGARKVSTVSPQTVNYALPDIAVSSASPAMLELKNYGPTDETAVVSFFNELDGSPMAVSAKNEGIVTTDNTFTYSIKAGQSLNAELTGPGLARRGYGIVSISGQIPGLPSSVKSRIRYTDPENPAQEIYSPHVKFRKIAYPHVDVDKDGNPFLAGSDPSQAIGTRLVVLNYNNQPIRATITVRNIPLGTTDYTFDIDQKNQAVIDARTLLFDRDNFEADPQLRFTYLGGALDGTPAEAAYVQTVKRGQSIIGVPVQQTTPTGNAVLSVNVTDVFTGDPLPMQQAEYLFVRFNAKGRVKAVDNKIVMTNRNGSAVLATNAVSKKYTNQGQHLKVNGSETYHYRDTGISFAKSLAVDVQAIEEFWDLGVGGLFNSNFDYDPNATITHPNAPEFDVWKSGIYPMDGLEMADWMIFRPIQKRFCSTINGWKLPTDIYLDFSNAPGLQGQAAREALTMWDTPDTKYFREVGSDPPLGMRYVWNAGSTGFALMSSSCSGPTKGEIRVGNVFANEVEFWKALLGHEEGHAILFHPGVNIAGPVHSPSENHLMFRVVGPGIAPSAYEKTYAELPAKLKPGTRYGNYFRKNP